MAQAMMSIDVLRHYSDCLERRQVVPARCAGRSVFVAAGSLLTAVARLRIGLVGNRTGLEEPITQRKSIIVVIKLVFLRQQTSLSKRSLCVMCITVCILRRLVSAYLLD